MLHGFDLSAFQSTNVPTCDFAFIKATEGSGYTSSKFAAQYANAKRNARVRGAYHFSRPEQSSAKSQAHRFLDVVQPRRGEIVINDLEASKLSQTATNAWARDFGDELRAETESVGVRTAVYLGSGYASTGTGRGLSAHYDLWWYPQYPSRYQLRRLVRALRLRGVHPRSSDAPRRIPIARATSLWPASFGPWLPSTNTTGWSKPHIWQFTDNWQGVDANVSWLTLDQLAGGGQPTPSPEEEDMAQRDLKEGLDQRSGLILPPKPGGYSYFEAFTDNTLNDDPVKPFAPVELRVAILRSNMTWQRPAHFVVGEGPGARPARCRVKLDDPNSVAISVTRKSGDGTEPIVITAY